MQSGKQCFLMGIYRSSTKPGLKISLVPITGPVAQSVASSTANPGVVSSIQAMSILSWRVIMK